MISVQQAFDLVVKSARLGSSIACPLPDCTGRILREKISSDRDYPALNCSSMDGIAISYQAWQEGQRTFELTACIAAGSPQIRVENKNSAVQIMTGAAVPKGLDTVIPIEDVRIHQSKVEITTQQVKPSQCVRFKGADLKKGDLALNVGTRLRAVHLALAASFGKKSLRVSKLMRFAIISTGDELVAINQLPKPHQVRSSNAFMIKTILEEAHLAQGICVHLPDNKVILKRRIAELLKKYDGLIISGGVSMGKFDFVPEALQAIGVRCVFHKVAQKPGKPLWFGLSKSHKPVFGLPGNPQSSAICTYRYVVPFVQTCLGEIIIQKTIPMQFDHSTSLTQFVLVNNQQKMSPTNSGDLARLAQADGFIEYDANSTTNQRPYFSWRI